MLKDDDDDDLAQQGATEINAKDTEIKNVQLQKYYTHNRFVGISPKPPLGDTITQLIALSS